MAYNIVLTTAEDIVAVVDAIVAKGQNVDTGFISEFTGIATDDQVNKALDMATELGMISHDLTTGYYSVSSYLAKKLVTAISDDQKAAIMRLILEQYQPYKVFKIRYCFTSSIEQACKQTKILCSLTSNERDIKNTLISIATYAKALKSEGANLYSFVEEENIYPLIESSLQESTVSEWALKNFWGETLYNTVDNNTVIEPLTEAFQKSKAQTPDTRAIVVYAANSFESFLDGYATSKGVSLVGRNGILQKRDSLNAHLSKKHRGMIDYIGQVRNAADHGADVDENGQMWTVTRDTALIYPCIVAITIKNILERDNGSIVV
ncbi:MAG: hypothetical protein IJA55_10195 [Clostridia bacterium]|nr:hypothetical protein [Clostridia bacterium]